MHYSVLIYNMIRWADDTNRTVVIYMTMGTGIQPALNVIIQYKYPKAGKGTYLRVTDMT